MTTVDPFYVPAEPSLGSALLSADPLWPLCSRRQGGKALAWFPNEDDARATAFVLNCRRQTKIRRQVREFHEAAGQPVLMRPQAPPEHRARLRMKLITEEYFEMLAAMLNIEHGVGEELTQAKQEIEAVISEAEVAVDVVELADALGDLDYVIEGTRLECGIDGAPVAAEIHRANMDKFGPGSKRREDGKVLKPPGWRPPDIGRVLFEKPKGWGRED